MEVNYCRKSCEDCAYQAELNCPGCKAGPGNPWGGDCQIACCVRDKGHETCETCGFVGGCSKAMDRFRAPEQRRYQQQYEASKQAAIASRAKLLGKWLWVLFWLVIPASLAGLLENNTVASISRPLYQFGIYLNVATSGAYGLILVKLHSVEPKYRTAGICLLISAGIQLLSALIGNLGSSLLLLLPGVILGLVSTYQEYTAHSLVLVGLDNELSAKWERLWKWQIGLLGALLGCVLLLIISPLLGVLVMIAAAIGIIVVSIVKLVYLYKTAKCFRNHPAFFQN